jgi:hypothetical protein
MKCEAREADDAAGQMVAIVAAFQERPGDWRGLTWGMYK